MYMSPNFHAATLLPTPVIARVPSLSHLDQLSLSKGDSQLQRWSSLIGIVTAIVGNILISFALNIQRYAHIRLLQDRIKRKEKIKNGGRTSQEGYGTANGDGVNGAEESLRQSFHSDGSQSTAFSDEDQQESTYLKSPYWWAGIVLMTIGEAGNFLAYGFAPASIVSPLGVVALISNCVIAPIMLKEQFRFRDFWGVVVAVAGAVVVVLSAKTQEKKLGPHEILGAITTMEFEIYMGVTIFLIAVLIWASPRYGSRTILIDLGLVGLFGGYTALSTKGVASMLSSTLWRALTSLVTYLLLVILFGTAVMQVRYVNKALQRFDSTQVIPVQFVMFTLSVIIGSAVLYRDFEKVTFENEVKFVGGCFLTFFGVFLITNGRPNRDDDGDDEEGDSEGEEQIGLTSQDLQDQETQRRSKSGFRNGDSANDPLESRRSSHVSFSEPSPLTKPSRHYSHSSYKPVIHVQSETPDSSLGTEETPLLEAASADDLLSSFSRRSGLPNDSSTAVLSSEGRADSEHPKSPPPRSTAQSNFNERPVTPARSSISRIMPGPLLSPLSSSLSVVIADSLRRVEFRRSGSFRRPRIGIRRSKSGSHRLVNPNDGDEDLVESSPLKHVDTAPQVSTSVENDGFSWTKTRARSLSNTLGDLFRGKRQKVDKIDWADEEAGPSIS
ncbi:hypothetical protein B7494_g3688 [Chlorociboria aeruginascens]|nr:hypothetical protein B7494_g3688 [Chlorociboria aeruginascens]